MRAESGSEAGAFSSWADRLLRKARAAASPAVVATKRRRSSKQHLLTAGRRHVTTRGEIEQATSLRLISGPLNAESHLKYERRLLVVMGGPATVFRVAGAKQNKTARKGMITRTVRL